MKYLITPNPAYFAEHVSQLLNAIGSGPMLVNPDRSVTVDLTDGQRDDFVRRGGSAHLMQAQAPPPPATPPPTTPPPTGP